MSFYTGKGDNGTSGLFGSCDRFNKDTPVFEFLGSLDELNSWIGLCKAWLRQSENDDAKRVSDLLEQAQQQLFIIQAQTAGADERLGATAVRQLESAIERLASSLEPAREFIIPGASLPSSLLDVGRTVARRCERSCVRAAAERPLPDQAQITAYLNRLSSLFYVMARFINRRRGVEEANPAYNRT